MGSHDRLVGVRRVVRLGHGVNRTHRENREQTEWNSEVGHGIGHKEGRMRGQ